jgi:hypothetical protein
MLASLWLGSLHVSLLVSESIIRQNELLMACGFDHWMTTPKIPQTLGFSEFEHIIHHQNLEMTGVCSK